MCKVDKVVETGYIKLLALNIDHLETTILMERNTNYQFDVDDFKETYGNNKSVVIFIIHMMWDDDIKFTDYKRICDKIHPFDYVKDLITRKNGRIIHRSDVINDILYDQSRIAYLQEE